MEGVRAEKGPPGDGTKSENDDVNSGELAILIPSPVVIKLSSSSSDRVSAAKDIEFMMNTQSQKTHQLVW